MKTDIVEQAAAAHAKDGFCKIINCPECEVRRVERIAPGKELRLLKADLEKQVQDLKAELAGAKQNICFLRRQMEQAQESRNFWMSQWQEASDDLEVQRIEAAAAWAEAAEAWETVTSFLK